MTDQSPPRGRLAARRWWSIDPSGAVAGLLLAALAVTPSLLPRPALLQGVIAAVAFGIGYAVASGAAFVVSRLTGRRFLRSTRRFWALYGVFWLAGIGILSTLAFSWQNEVRRMVQMPPLPGTGVLDFLTGFAPLVLLFLAAGKGVAGLFRLAKRRVGRPLALVATVGALVLALAGLVVGVLRVVDGIYAERNGRPAASVTEPASTYRSAGTGSAIAWSTLGRHGGNFVGGGPDAAEIAALTGLPAQQPIRVYAGLASAPTIAERARLVVAELERTGAFQRSVLVVATATGSGWLEPQTMDAIEFLHAGDTAVASMQYAYTPSWVSFVFDPDAPVEASRVLFEAVEARWRTLPADSRPALISYGLSLGAHGSQALFDDVAAVRARTDGALFVGSPNGSPLWRGLQASRDAGTPAWQPVLDDGREVRWMSADGDQHRPTAAWSGPRMLYLQHATDPVTWLGPELLWRSPEWLERDQRASDISDSMVWIPLITGVQVTIDMLGGEAVPARHGHNFGDVVLPGWREVTGDAGLDDAALARVQQRIEAMAAIPVYPDPVVHE